MAKRKSQAPTQEMKNLIKASGSLNKEESLLAVREIAKALELPLRQGIMDGNILGDIFEVIPLEPEGSPEFPLDFLVPGTEKDWVAYSIPNHGYIPQRHIEGDFVMIPTYEVGAAIDWNLKYARASRFDILSRATTVFKDSFVRKWNIDGWHTIIAAGADRNIIVLDSAAAAGQFTKRLVNLMKIVMRRNGGGNGASGRGGRLTDLFVSPEAMADMRDWDVDEVDEVTRREIFVSENENAISRIFGVNLHDLYELGEGQEFQVYYEDELGGDMPAGDVEIVIGLDLSNNDSFVMPVREGVQMFEDETLHRQRRAGLYGWAEQGFGVLNNTRVLLGSL